MMLITVMVPGGTCHSVCPQEAVRHDSEKIPENIKTNVRMTKKFMEACAKYLGGAKEKDKIISCLPNKRTLYF